MDQEALKRYYLNVQLAQMLKGGVIMDVVTPEHAVIAQEAGAVAVMAIEVPDRDARQPVGEGVAGGDGHGVQVAEAHRLIAGRMMPGRAHERKGALAAPGTPLVRLVETAEPEVSAALRPEEVEAVRQATALHFQYLGARMPVQLRRAVPVVDPRTRPVEARLTFTGPGASPGASGRLVWSDATPHVPGDLLVRRGGRLGVLVADDGTARFVPLDGAQEGQPAPLALPAGTRIGVEGRERLNDGDPVNGRE